MRLHRDQALACLILALCVTSAAYLSIYGGTETTNVEVSWKAVAFHEQLLKEAAETLQKNQDSLNSDRASLTKLEWPHQLR